MKKRILFIMLPVFSVLFVQLAVAQKKTSHKEYADQKVADCNSCHKSEGVAPNHDADWVRGHRLLSNQGEKNCVDCHDQSFCLDCHTGGGIDASLSTRNYRADYVPKSHRSDWLELHPMKALDNRQTCYRCHDSKYCSQCHSKFRSDNLQFLSHRRQFKDLSAIGTNHANFTAAQCQICHPKGQLPSHKQWAGDHAREARRNLQACQTCHSDGDVCLKCHSARAGSGLRVSPHPRRWGSIKGNYNRQMCLRCHDSTDPALR